MKRMFMFFALLLAAILIIPQSGAKASEYVDWDTGSGMVQVTGMGVRPANAVNPAQARNYGSNEVGGTLIFQFDDDYKLKGRDDNVAFFALRKAALNSSRALAEHTLDYWKKH